MIPILRVVSFNWSRGVGKLEGGFHLLKKALGVLDGGVFRYYRSSELMRPPVVGEEVYYQLSRRDESRVFWWAYLEHPSRRLLPPIGAHEESTVVMFIRGKSIGFMADPMGGEDLLIHTDKQYMYRCGEFVETKQTLRPPIQDAKIRFVRDETGRIRQWAEIPSGLVT